MGPSPAVWRPRAASAPSQSPRTWSASAHKRSRSSSRAPSGRSPERVEHVPGAAAGHERPTPAVEDPESERRLALMSPRGQGQGRLRRAPRTRRRRSPGLPETAPSPRAAGIAPGGPSRTSRARPPAAPTPRRGRAARGGRGVATVGAASASRAATRPGCNRSKGASRMRSWRVGSSTPASASKLRYRNSGSPASGRRATRARRSPAGSSAEQLDGEPHGGRPPSGGGVDGGGQIRVGRPRQAGGQQGRGLLGPEGQLRTDDLAVVPLAAEPLDGERRVRPGCQEHVEPPSGMPGQPVDEGHGSRGTVELVQIVEHEGQVAHEQATQCLRQVVGVRLPSRHLFTGTRRSGGALRRGHEVGGKAGHPRAEDVDDGAGEAAEGAVRRTDGVGDGVGLARPRPDQRRLAVPRAGHDGRHPAGGHLVEPHRQPRSIEVHPRCWHTATPPPT